MRPNIYLLSVLLIVLSLSIKGQNTERMGLLPSINISTSLKDNFKLITGIESRQRLLDSRNMPASSYDYVLTDIANFIRYKSGAYSSMALGYTLRIEDSKRIHRLSQQYNWVQSLSVGRIAHRLVSDQTFEPDIPISLRTRYRIVIEKPLNGDQIDPRELYLKIGQESILILEDGEGDIELRLVPRLGLEFGKKSKIEWGLDYRLKSPFMRSRRQDFYLTMSYYTSLSSK